MHRQEAGRSGCVALSSPTEKPTFISIRLIACFTAIACIIAQFLSRGGDPRPSDHSAPLVLVVGQAMWNACEVGLLLLLLCLWLARRRWPVLILGAATLLCLPFAVYALSPGAAALAVLLLTICLIGFAGNGRQLPVTITDSGPGTPLFAKFEFLALICNLLCSMYNFFGTYWDALYGKIASLVRFDASTQAIARAMYTLGIRGVTLPAYIHLGRTHNNLGALIFLLIWTVLPSLYVLYFAALATLAKASPGTRVQQALCALCIFHFLFLTDLVDYEFGRGLANFAADWSHELERIAWRIAILLPVYQKLTTGQWLRGNGRIGVIVHYAMAVWAVVFVVYDVVLYQTRAIYGLLTGHMLFNKLLGHGYVQPVGYLGALVLMVLLYGFMLVAMRCKRFEVLPIGEVSRRQNPTDPSAAA